MRRFNKTFAVTGILLAALTLAIFSTLWVLSPPAAAESARVSLPEANKALIQSAFEEVLNDGHLAAANEIFAANFRQHVPNLPTVTLGSEGVKLLATLYRSAFFDLHYTVEDMVAVGDKVVIRWAASGLYIRPFGLYAPSGQPVTWTGMTIYRIANGQIVEAWTIQDNLNFIKQLGATTLNGTAWGPSYYAGDTNVEVGRNRPKPEFMKQVDPQALTEKTWGLAHYH